MWTLQLVEARARQHRNEMLTNSAAIGHVMTRLNEFISKLRPSAHQIPKSKAKAKATGKTRPEHQTLEAALTAANSCKKRRPTKECTKGCSECMGSWFAQIRVRKAG